MATKKEQIEKAAKHFIELYSEEIEAGENIKGGVIHEWWGMTVEQDDQLSLDDLQEIEDVIFSKL